MSLEENKMDLAPAGTKYKSIEFRCGVADSSKIHENPFEHKFEVNRKSVRLYMSYTYMMKRYIMVKLLDGNPHRNGKDIELNSMMI